MNLIQERTGFEKFLDKVDEVIETKGIAIIKSSENYDARFVSEDIRQFSSVVASSLPNESNRVVIRYRIHLGGQEISLLRNQLHKAIQINDCIEIIRCSNLLIASIEKLNGYYLNIAAQAYYTLGNYQKAVDYFTVAKKNSSRKYFSYYDGKISQSIRSEKKRKRKLSYSGYVDNLEQILSLISEDCSDINHICKQFHLLPNQVSVVKLSAARVCYARGDTMTGDILVNSINRRGISEYVVNLRRDTIFNRNNFQQDIGHPYVKVNKA